MKALKMGQWGTPRVGREFRIMKFRSEEDKLDSLTRKDTATSNMATSTAPCATSPISSPLLSI